MSRSYKKPFVTLSKRWDKFKEKRYRKQVKQELNKFDPDKDWEELNLSMKGIESWGTKCGFDIELDEDDKNYGCYNEMKRK